MVRASRSKRCLASEFSDRCDGRILTATVRSRRVSRARYTSPMPPAPSGDWISYGPSFVPEARGMFAGNYSPGSNSRRDVTRVRIEESLGMRRLETDDRLRHGRVPGNNLIHAGKLQHLFDVFVGAGQPQLSTCLLHLAGGRDDDPDPGTVDMGHTAQVKDDLLLLFLADQAVDSPFQLLALAANGDSARDLQNDNVRRQLLGLNVQHKTKVLSNLFSFDL